MFITMFSDFVSQKYQQPQKKLKIKKYPPKNYLLIPCCFYLYLLLIFLERTLIVSKDVKRQIHSLNYTCSNTSGPTHPPVIEWNFPTNFFSDNFFE